MATINKTENSQNFNVSLCQEVERLQAIEFFDFNYSDPRFRSYVKSRIGFSGMVSAAGVPMSPAEVVSEIWADLPRWRLLRAQIQDCYNIFMIRDRDYL